MAEFSHWTRGRCMKTCTFKWNIHLVWLLINSGRLWWIHIYITTQKKTILYHFHMWTSVSLMWSFGYVYVLVWSFKRKSFSNSNVHKEYGEWSHLKFIQPQPSDTNLLSHIHQLFQAWQLLLRGLISLYMKNLMCLLTHEGPTDWTIQYRFIIWSSNTILWKSSTISGVMASGTFPT